MIVLNGEEGLECELHIDVICLEHVTEFNYWRCVLAESGTDGAECSRKVASGRKVADCLCMFFCMAVRQCYGKKRRDLEYRWRTLEDC